jgi:16S rRNA (guanine527-N7)-methyltransferase
VSERVRRRLSDLAERHGLPAQAVPALGGLLAILATDPTAPTTITDPVAAVDSHVADALVALDLEPVRAARLIADIGAGAGFPGLVLAAALPATHVALVEASAKKCAFLTRTAEAIGLRNVEVVTARAEEWTGGIARCEVVTARAVAPLNVLVEYAAPLLTEGGVLIAWKGRRDPAEEADADAAASMTGLRPDAVHAVRPWAGAEHLHLHLYVKVGTTPNRFPRRAGMARKRPLRAST